jgi:hypothetical protein
MRFYFNESQPFYSRYIVITKNAVRVYEDRARALSTYGRPLIAIPLAAVKRVERVKFDMRDDIRFENPSDYHLHLTKNLLEFELKDEFLPIYTHAHYTKMFKETSITMELSPNKKANSKLQSSISPYRNSTISKSSVMQGGPSPTRASHMLDMHKRTGHEMKQSPSKASKIVMRYINSYADVGPQIS